MTVEKRKKRWGKMGGRSEEICIKKGRFSVTDVKYVVEIMKRRKYLIVK